MNYHRVVQYPNTTIVDATRRRLLPWYLRLSWREFVIVAVALGVAAVCLGVPIYLALR